MNLTDDLLIEKRYTHFMKKIQKKKTNKSKEVNKLP